MTASRFICTWTAACGVALLLLLSACSTPSGHSGTPSSAPQQAAVVAGNRWSSALEDRKRALDTLVARPAGMDVSRTADNQLRLLLPADLAFESGRNDVRPAARPALDAVAANWDAGLRMRVVVHTDNTGPDAANQAASLVKAQMVRDYLVTRGVPAARIEAVGRGEREPMADNATDAGRARNRRIEVLLRDPEGAR